MDYKPGDSVTATFSTQVFATGAAANADSTPTGVVNRNGTDDVAVTVTITNLATGRYKAVFTIPATYIPGDVLNLSISVIVSTITGNRTIWHCKVGVGVIRASTAQGGTADSITLDASASAVTDYYRDAWIFIVSGTGAGQGRVCSAFDATTKIATTVPSWATTPNSTSVFVVLPVAGVDLETIGGQPVLDSTGSVNANLTRAIGSPFDSRWGWVAGWWTQT